MNRLRSLRHEDGVSLVELVVTLGLFALILTGVVSVWGRPESSTLIGRTDGPRAAESL